MRELHGYHGEHRRHARDAHAPADNPPTRAHDSPGRAVQDALKLRMLRDPEARKAARLAYQQKVEAAEAGYAARHAKPGVEARAPDQRRPPEPKPEHAPPESRDKPANGIGQRSLPEQKEAVGQPRRERSWLPRADSVKAITDTVMFGTATAVAFGLASAKWEAVAASGAAAIVSHITLANRRRKEKHGDRPKG